MNSLDKATIGKLGEDYATQYLANSGYKIIKRNFKTRFGEVDIIAEKDDVISFVEVKTRSKNSLYTPREAVNLSKQKKIILASSEYILVSKTEKQPRFDIFEIICEAKISDFKIVSCCFLENAFQL